MRRVSRLGRIEVNLSHFPMVGFAVVSLLLIALSVTYLRLRAIKSKESKLLTDVTERLQRQKEATEVARAEAEQYRAEAQKQSARAETARKTVETQVTKLQELDKAKSRFFANVSHDCRTPLMLTIGPLEDLRDGLHGPIPSQISREIRVAIRNAHRLLHLINEMLDVVKIEAGQIGLRPRRVDLVRFIDDIVDSFSILAERKRMHLRVETPPGSLEVSFDRNVLEKIVVNLVANALKFTPDGGTVRVTAELIGEVESDGESGKELRITVRDSGPGIPAEEIPNIFERFYRAGKSRRLHQGSGIGLSLTKDLAELHGGRIDAQSDEGFGSKFVVTIPVQAGDGQASEEMAGVAVPPPPGEDAVGAFEVEVDAEQDSAEHPESPLDEEDVTTVLVVEDDREMRSYLRKHLAQQYRVLEAADGQQGLDMVKRWLPDLIVSDVVMPRLDGHALSQAVIQDPELSYIPVILLTATADNDHKIEGLESGALDYLVKPIEMKELLAKIKNLLDSRRRLLQRMRPVGTSAAKALRASSVEVVSADEVLLERIKSVIETHLDDEDFSVQTLADKVGLSRGHLHRRLTDLLKQPPTDVIRTIRLERAASLLEGKVGSVSEVAYATGFKSVAHFSKCFKDSYGHSPSQHVGTSSGTG